MQYKAKPARAGKLAGMRLVRGGTFLMGSEDHYEDEKPLRQATVGDFWIEETPVTNAQFARFIDATGHVTFAECPPNPVDYPGMLPEMGDPGSIVFVPPSGAVDLKGPPVRWQFVIGAWWREPLGPGSSIAGLDDHPVVQSFVLDPSWRAWASATASGPAGKRS